jgi:hypothetical protein
LCDASVFDLRTVRLGLLAPDHWKFPDLASVREKSATPQQLRDLQNAVYYEYAREFDTLTEHCQKERHERKNIDANGNWHFTGMASISNAPFSNLKALGKEQWHVSFVASSDFPDKPATAMGLPAPSEKTAPAVVTLKELKTGDSFELQDFTGRSHYIISIDWDRVNDDLIKEDFPAWVAANQPQRRSGKQGRADSRQAEQDLKALAIVRLACQYGSLEKAWENSPAGHVLYARRGDWDAAFLQGIINLGEWGLVVQSIKPPTGKELTLEYVTLLLAKDILTLKARQQSLI